MNKTLRAVRWVCITMLGIVAMFLAAAVMRPPDPPRVSLEIEIDPVTGQGRVAAIDNQTGYVVTNLVLRGTTVRFDLVAP